MAVSKIGVCTGDGVRVRSSASTSSNKNVVTSIYSGLIVFTNASTTSGSGYSWYYIYFTKDDYNYKGYVVTNYINVLDESINFSTNYTSGNSLTLSWSSVYSSYIGVSYTLTDNKGNSFLVNGSNTSYTISNLSSYYYDGEYITFTLKVSYGSGYNFYKSDEYRYASATLSLGNFTQAPVIQSINNNNNGTYTISWSAASWSGGNTNVRYEVFVYNNGTKLTESDYITNLYQANVSIPLYDTQLSFYVKASLSSGSDKTINSGTVTKTFHSPTLSKPQISISNTKGQSVIVTRDDSYVNYGSATSITYDLYRGSKRIGTFSEKTYPIDQATLESWNQTNIAFLIRATASGVIPNLTSDGKLYADSDTITFTFEPYKTILYYTGNGPINGYEECIVYYYTGNSNEGNNGWVECEPYLYTGESTATINGWQLCSYT